MQIDYEYLSRIRRAVALYTHRKTSNILDGDFHSIHKGRSMEFDDLKEYTFGDDVHDIDWKSSSRMGTILVREYMTDRRHNVMFIGDCGRKMMGDTSTGESKKNLAVLTFGTVAYITGRNGADYALAHPRATGTSISMFRSGPEHLEKLLYSYEEDICKNVNCNLNEIISEIMSTVKKKMIIFVITDIEGLATLDEGVIKGVTTNHDLLIYHVDDATLTGDSVYDMDFGRYEKSFFSHDRALREAEVQTRREIIDSVAGMCRRNKVGITTISSESEIIGSTIDLLERYKHGNYGYVTKSF
ncbi:DUF58 domain-containing protein [Butyrivibrio proteoclasticus]|uniref:DUF58 domain-containing protein n=1 Tax=Butyrivibrio proteoclasticus TaxID=43305 RepID=UPI00047C8EED|nr:DUF58 domain-containing protein [Butyrivibrio proteoclasticus]